MQQAAEMWIAAHLIKAAGAGAAAIGSFLLGRFWLGALQPWLQSIWWSGMRLAPTYQGEFIQIGTGNVLSDHVEVKQKATKVWGTMAVAAGRAGKYEFKATLVDGTLRGTFQSVGDQAITKGSFLLAAQPGSSDLRGWCLEPIDGQVIAYEYKWRARPR